MEVCEIKEDILNIEEESTDEKVGAKQEETQQKVVELSDESGEESS